MSEYPELTAREEFEQWQNLSKMPDCIDNGRFVPSDIRAMLNRMERAEKALSQIAGARVMGTPDETSRAQIEAMVEMAKAGLPEVCQRTDRVMTNADQPGYLHGLKAALGVRPHYAPDPYISMEASDKRRDAVQDFANAIQRLIEEVQDNE